MVASGSHTVVSTSSELVSILIIEVVRRKGKSSDIILIRDGTCVGRVTGIRLLCRRLVLQVTLDEGANARLVSWTLHVLVVDVAVRSNAKL